MNIHCTQRNLMSLNRRDGFLSSGASKDYSEFPRLPNKSSRTTICLRPSDLSNRERTGTLGKKFMSIPKKWFHPSATKIIFCSGALMLLVYMIVSEHFAPGGQYRNGHDNFRKFELPLIATSAGLCIFAPLFGHRPLRSRILLCFLAIPAFGLVTLLVVLLSFIFFGLPDQD